MSRKDKDDLCRIESIENALIDLCLIPHENLNRRDLMTSLKKFGVVD